LYVFIVTAFVELSERIGKCVLFWLSANSGHSTAESSFQQDLLCC